MPAALASASAFLAIENHRETNRLQALFTAQRIIKLDRSSPLLPVAQLEQKAHRRTARITSQDRLEALGRLPRREDRRGDKLIFDGRVIPRDAGAGRAGTPDVGLRAGAGGDLIVGRERREFDLQHTARGAGGDVLEGDARFDGVGVGAAGAGQFECLARRGGVGEGFAEYVDV